MKKPNVLFILTDDQRFDTIHALGNPHIHTPNLDTLANDGSAFYRHFCTTPICTPARAEILTGCNTFTNKVPWFGMPINPELTLMPKAFRDAGYHTMHCGKWHNDGHPRDKGYDAVHCAFGTKDNLNDYQEHAHYMRFKEPYGEVEDHGDALFADAALYAIDHAPSDMPWFCYLAFHGPHDPHVSPEPFASMYNAADMPLYPNHMPEHPFDNGDMVIRDELIENWPREQDAMRRYRARYYGMISHIDHQIGRVLGLLKARGELENTIIMFTGDQGVANGSHGLLGKENMYDHSIASPFVIRGPGIPVGGRFTAMSHHVDILPTLCDLAEISRPSSASDGFSLVPVLRGEKERVRDAILCEFYSPEEPGEPMRNTQRCVRTERWKLAWYPLIGRYQLFDLANDQYELCDLLTGWRKRRREFVVSGKAGWRKDAWAAYDPRPRYTQTEIERTANELHARMCSLMKEQGDPLATTVPPIPG